MTANYRHGSTAGFMALCLIVGLFFIPATVGATTWNVSNTGGGEYNNYTSLLNISGIDDGDTIRIWGVDGYTCEGGITIGVPNVLIKRWEGSPVRPLITNTSETTPAITVTANNVTLQGLNISDNSLTDANGAGVYAAGTDTDTRLDRFTVRDCLFSNNTVYGNDCAGAAMYLEYVDNIVITSTTFEENRAEFHGGGVYFYYSDDATLTGTTFVRNQADRYGGGAGFRDSDRVTLTDTIFNNNGAQYNAGGASFRSSAGATLDNTTFKYNYVEDTGSGGGVNFCDNSDDATLTDTTFENNQAANGGGAYFEESGEVSLTRTTFVNNQAEVYGGGAVFVESTPSLTDTIFEHNMAESGAGVFFVNSITTLTDTIFVNNSATNDGGGFFVTGIDENTRLDHFTVRDCLFSNNTITNDDSRGGAMYLQYVDNIAITNTAFEENRAIYGGGAYLYMSDNAALTNTTFKSNVGNAAGGGVHFNNSNSATLTETTFESNRAIGGAGAFFIESDGATLAKTTFVNNMAMIGGGGAFFRSSDNPIIKNCLFDNYRNLGADESSAGAVLNEVTPIPGTNIIGGPYLGGNAWFQDPTQNISEWGTDADFDGICDQPLEINCSGTVFGTDAFPLVYGGGTVTVTSTPAGADIHLDGVKITRTTDGSLYLPVGDHTITVSREGYVTPATKPVTTVEGETTTVTFALKKIPAPTRAPGGHGSGGGCSDLSADAANGLLAGANASFTMQNSAIHEIRITAGESIQKILITVGKTGLPSGTDAPTDNIYEYDEVLIYHATDDMIAGATLNFSVSKEWLTENEFVPGDVVLYRLHDGEWQKLLVTLTGEDTGSYYFTARSPGFSVFAIGAEQSTEVAATQTPAPTFANGSTKADNMTTPTPTKTRPTPTQSPIPYGLSILATGLAYLLKKRQE